MTEFDPLQVPLQGVQLIEASAGTGKTYAITELYVRLVVEHGLGTDQILVVTFTQAATEELRDRIRRRLADALRAITGDRDENPFLESLVARAPSRASGMRRLASAISDFDRAAIYTIHGFCHRLLQDHAFEAGAMFDTELSTDASPYLIQVADDFWHQHVHDLPPLAARYIQEELKGPGFFLNCFNRCSDPEITVRFPEGDPAPLNPSELEACYIELRSLWHARRTDILDRVDSAPLNGNVYGTNKPSKTDPHLSSRQERLQKWRLEIDGYLARQVPSLKLPRPLERLSRSQVTAYTRKGKTPPSDPFFEVCDRFVALCRDAEAHFRHMIGKLVESFFTRAEGELEALKRGGNIQFYDDLLLRVQRALISDDGERLRRPVRHRYHAALVDEFQDTDALQYDIFRRLFHGSESLLFMIGDPKQAIYSFRGADIFSYLSASRESDHRFTLGTNWRSSAGLVASVNALFGEIRHPFLMRAISFMPSVAADHPNGSGDVAGQKPSMVFWHLPQPAHTRDGGPFLQAEAANWIAGMVGDEILRLTSEPAGGMPPADIAILVRTNRQGQDLSRRLKARGIPCVLYSSESVFQTREAEGLFQVMTAMASPHPNTRLRAAMATELLGVSADIFAASLEEPGSREFGHHVDTLYRLHRQWLDGGFMRAFYSMLRAFHVRERLLDRVDGQRRMTNLLHLAELIHRAELEHPVPISLVDWLGAQMTRTDNWDDAAQLRLETDAGAVKIVTIHKSKGLEYPVVFCPYLWSANHRQTDPVLFHDPEDGDRPVLDFGSDDIGRSRYLAGVEAFAEELRLLYVTLTRACHRCYVVWDRHLKAGASALAYVIHQHRLHPEIEKDLPASDLRNKRFRDLGDADLAEDFQKLETASDGNIRFVTAPDPIPEMRYPPMKAPDAVHGPRQFAGTIAGDWRVVSYSSLVARAPVHRISVKDEDVAGGGVHAEPFGALSGFPRGAVAGSCLHRIFEDIDYRQPDSPDLSAAVSRSLSAFGFDTDWTPAVAANIRDVLNAPLSAGESPLRLRSLAPADRVNEMGFYYPLRRLTPAGLALAFDEAGVAGFPGTGRSWSDRLVFSPVRGFLKGYIDLWFQQDDRFFIVDWKSNYLGEASSDYSPDRLAQEMAAAYYPLQYHLYVIALDLHLKRRYPGYRYRDHFGGVFYLFLRGIHPDQETPNGIFFDRPEPDAIRHLEGCLVDRSGGTDNP